MSLDLRRLFELSSDLERREAVLARVRAQDRSLALKLERMIELDERYDIAPGPPNPLPTPGGVAGPVPLERIGRYRIVRRIGAGGGGVVFEATQDLPSRRVALKILHPGRVDAQCQQRFEREANALARIDHAGVASVHDYDVVDLGFGPQPFFVMGLVEGHGLLEFCRLKRLSDRDRVRLVARVASALHHVHLKGVVHRDVKPANIIVRPNGQPVLVDFGVARLLNVNRADRTATGQLLGTLRYMSPEQMNPRLGEADARTDVFSLGLVLYELLAGRLPYDFNGSAAQRVRAIADSAPTMLGALRKDLRWDIQHVARKAIEKRPEDRYQSASEFRDDLARAESGDAIAAHRPDAPARLWRSLRRHRRAAVVSGVMLFVSIAALVAFGGMYHQRRLAVQHEAHLRTLSRSVSDAFGLSLLLSGSISQPVDRDVLAWIDDLPMVSEDWAMSCITMSVFARQVRDWPHAEALLTAVVDRMPSHCVAAIRARSDLAFLKLETGDPESALRHAQRSYAMSLQSAEATDSMRSVCASVMALTYSYLGDERNARHYLEVALAHDETWSESKIVPYHFARLLIRYGYHGMARECYFDPLVAQAADGRLPRHIAADVYSLRASLLYSNGDLAAAESSFRIAMENSSPVDVRVRDVYASALQGLGVCMRDQGRLDEAMDVMLESVDLRAELYGTDDLKYADALVTLANVHQLRGDARPEAIAIASRGLSLRQGGARPLDVAEAQLALGVLLLQSDRSAEAYPLLAEASAAYAQLRDDWRADYARGALHACDARLCANRTGLDLARSACRELARRHGRTGPWTVALARLCEID